MKLKCGVCPYWHKDTCYGGFEKTPRKAGDLQCYWIREFCVTQGFKQNKVTLPAGQEKLFKRFWDAWPKGQRKKNPDRARAIWKKLSPDAVTVGKILACLHAEKNSPQWTKDDGQYIPYPNRWLKSNIEQQGDSWVWVGEVSHYDEREELRRMFPDD